jgi:hypothetical protein
MVSMLDRRSYLRNLLREVYGVLTSQGVVGEKANI